MTLFDPYIQIWYIFDPYIQSLFSLYIQIFLYVNELILKIFAAMFGVRVDDLFLVFNSILIHIHQSVYLKNCVN